MYIINLNQSGLQELLFFLDEIFSKRKISDPDTKRKQTLYSCDQNVEITYACEM